MRKKYKFLFILIFLYNATFAQTITTYAGDGVAGYTGDGGLATLAKFTNPFSVAFGNDNNLYIADNSNNRIRKVDAITHIITTVVGLGNNGGNCLVSQAALLNPRGIAFDKQGNMYISDAGTCIRKVDIATQTITTIAGIRGTPNIYGNVLGDNGPAINAFFEGAAGIAIDGDGNVFVADMNNGRIRKIDISTGIITTFAGGANIDPGGGHLATEAALNQPLSIAFDSKGNLIIADVGNHLIRKIDVSTNIISTIAGSIHTWGYSGDGALAINALLNTPIAVTLDKNDNIYITDCLNNRVRKIDHQTGIISTIAGTGIAGYAGDCGPAKDALLDWPWSIVLDKAEQIYFTELNNSTVRKIAAIESDLINGSENICLHDSIILSATKPGGVWTSDNDAVAYIDSNGLVKGLKEGTTIIHYTIKLGGCEFITANHTINVNFWNENAAFTTSKNLCTGTTLALSQPISGGIWYSNNINVATIDTAGNLQCLNTGIAELKYMLNRTCNVTDKIFLQIFKPEKIFLGNDTSICNNTTVTINAGNDFIKYNWNTNDTTQSITIKTAGTYWLNATDVNTCVSRDSISITYKPSVLIDLGKDTTLCENTTKLLTTKMTNATYLWQDGSKNPDYLVNKAGSYYVMATKNSCSAVDTINIAYIPKPLLTLGRDTFICKGLSIEIRPTLNTTVEYHWQDGNTFSFYNVTDAGKYILTVSNECGTATSSVVISQGLCDLFAPTAFSPNNDYLNDIFRVKYPFAVKKFSMAIYNRFGQKIFETEDMSKGWDGTFKGDKQPVDAYVWIISLTDIDGRNKTVKGTVMLIK